ncbi:hypothetical protein SynTAK9802_00183 [Synechococcus sp. TAK9802]|nr:hypothetical protein SynTAK9802_00183 [Synechococcus sp. TAK9802]
MPKDLYFTRKNISKWELRRKIWLRGRAPSWNDIEIIINTKGRRIPSRSKKMLVKKRLEGSYIFQPKKFSQQRTSNRSPYIMRTGYNQKGFNRKHESRKREMIKAINPISIRKSIYIAKS